jgi:hypothetical protein
MFGVLRPADAGPRGTAARLGLVALLACVGLTWTAGASDAFATYGTVTIKKVNQGGDQTDRFHFTSSLPNSGGSSFWVNSGGEYTTGKLVHANAGRYDAAPYYVTEDAKAGYQLKDITCTVTPAPYKAKVGSTTAYEGQDQRKVAIKVGVDEKVYCVFTNEKTARITVKKDLKPVADAGRFDLQVDGKNVASGVGNGGSGSADVAPGTHQVGETGANLGDYVRSVKCTKPNGYVVAEGAGPVDVKVYSSDDITCVVKNVRKAKIVVAKTTVPADTAAVKTKFGFTVNPGAVAFDLTHGQSQGSLVEPDKAYTVAEADPAAKGYKLTAIQCTSGTSNVAARTATVTPQPGETVTCTYTNAKLQPGIKVVKSGPAFAYSGDTLDFGFDVTNTGERRLHDVGVTDDKCSPVVGPVSKAGGNADDILDPGETWHYTCSYVATHTLGDTNPVVNTVTAQAKDDEDKNVEDQDQHSTLFLHPAIDIEKTGPATALAGSLVTYTLDVTNPGDVSLGGVDVTDPRCTTAPVRTSVNADATPDTLEPGDHWTYTCSVQTQAGQTQVVNVGDVKGTDEHDRVVTDEDTFTTTLTQPVTPVTPQTPPTTTPGTPAAPVAAQQVAGVQQASRPRRGTAALRGPRACPRTTAVSATVTGRQIRRVTFLVRGKVVKTVTKADSRGRWTLKLRTASLRRGANSVVARVQFTTASQTRTRTLRITIARCAAQQVRPQFTG